MKSLDLEKYEGLIFDLDGTLIDSMPVHNQAWIETIAREGYELSEKVLFELAGISTLRTAEIFNERYGWDLDPQKVAQAKEAKYIDRIETVKLADKVIEIANANYNVKPLAIVTGGEKQVVHKVLKTLDIEKLFPVVVCAEDTKRGKEFPDPFLLAATQMRINPQKCVVFEDGEVGIKGARSAGMDIVKIDLRSKNIFV